jgi:hypothetical protein
MDNFSIVDQVVLTSIAGGFIGNLFFRIVERIFFVLQSEKNNQKRFLLDVTLASIGIGIGLVMGIMTFTVITIDPKNIEIDDFLGVFIGTFYLSSSPIWVNIFKLIYTKALNLKKSFNLK